jgi:hypothetical protein
LKDQHLVALPSIYLVPHITGPFLWRTCFDAKTIADLVSFNNPVGKVINLDLELAASIVQLNVAANQFNICKQTVASRLDNTPTIAWQSKGSTTTVSALAAPILFIVILHPWDAYSTSQTLNFSPILTCITRRPHPGN